MVVLGVESSCDETAFSIVKDGVHVLSSVVASQVDVHAVFGGVVPEVAAREHLKVIAPLFQQAIQEAGIQLSDIDLISVTRGPGLIGALLVGVSFAKGLATSLNKPLIPVDHVHAHVHGALLGIENANMEEIFPALSLVVSGGHTNLYYMENATDFQLLATTIDDACGECFDKVGKLLGFGYPAGPIIEKTAQGGNDKAYEMPKMVQDKSRLQFSYSGLKTHMVYRLQKQKDYSEQELKDLCASFQSEALGLIQRKIKIALKKRTNVRSVIIAGGVAANQKFRSMLSELPVKTYFPKLKYCSDNAAMIAALGWHEYPKRKENEDFLNDHNWDAYSRYDFQKYFVQV